MTGRTCRIPRRLQDDVPAHFNQPPTVRLLAPIAVLRAGLKESESSGGLDAKLARQKMATGLSTLMTL